MLIIKAVSFLTSMLISIIESVRFAPLWNGSSAELPASIILQRPVSSHLSFEALRNPNRLLLLPNTLEVSRNSFQPSQPPHKIKKAAATSAELLAIFLKRLFFDLVFFCFDAGGLKSR